MRKGQNMVTVLLVCVFVICLTTIFMLGGITTSVNSTLAEGHQKDAAVSTVDITSHNTPNLIVDNLTGNVAGNSPMPCCANAETTGCGPGIQNCTYLSGTTKLSCPSKTFDRNGGKCV
jgi:hypothetical protein